MYQDAQHRRNDEERHDADGHVDVEDPAPRHVLGEESAGKWAEDARETEDGAEVAHVAATLTRRDDVTDDRLRTDHQSSGTSTLDGATQDEFEHVLREAGKNRTRQEDDDRDLEEPLAPVEVAELAPQGSNT